MILFIIISVIFCLAATCMLKWFFTMIQPEGALDIAFGWQKMLQRLYNGSKWQQLRGKALGDCQMCTCFWFMPLWFAFYYIFSKLIVHYWITDALHVPNIFIYWLGVCLVNLSWYACFHSIGAMVGLVTLNKIFNK